MIFLLISKGNVYTVITIAILFHCTTTRTRITTMPHLCAITRRLLLFCGPIKARRHGYPIKCNWRRFFISLSKTSVHWLSAAYPINSPPQISTPQYAELKPIRSRQRNNSGSLTNINQLQNKPHNFLEPRSLFSAVLPQSSFEIRTVLLACSRVLCILLHL
jgi:hypothetical protein